MSEPFAMPVLDARRGPSGRGRLAPWLCALCVSALAACASQSSGAGYAVEGAQPMADSAMPMASHAMALASLGPTQGSTVLGSVEFHEHGDAVMVHAHVRGLEPNSVHGFHIHDKGDCASPDGSSAGGHYNPEGHHHGPQDAEHHAGDMPNLQADAQGVADTHFELHGVHVGQGSDDIVGHSLIVHAHADDYASQPAGNAGPRLACGVIVEH